MAIRFLRWGLGSLLAGTDGPCRLSRRAFLAGTGAAAAALALGVASRPAEAQTLKLAEDDGILPMSTPAEGEVHLAQYYNRRRYSRREVRYRCRNDRRFRRRNPGLCQSVERRGRRGACVQLGPLLICD
jgi:hypothetical protein